MTKTDPKRDGTDRPAGYRGTLPPREDRLARPWVLLIFGALVLIFVLSFVGIPSRLIPDPTPAPVPTLAPTPSPEATDAASPEATGEPTDEASPEPTGS
jgi:hypothetical protein